MLDERLPESFTAILQGQEDVLDDPAVLDLFAERVEAMMRDQLDLLLSTLYRLDVEEHKIQHALHFANEPPARAIARLILERQKERLRTRRAYGQVQWDDRDPEEA
jgi:hypothetical protein